MDLTHITSIHKEYTICIPKALQFNYKKLLDYQVKIIKSAGIQTGKKYVRIHTAGFLERKATTLVCVFISFSPDSNFNITCFGLSYVFRGNIRVGGVVLVDLGQCQEIAIGDYAPEYSALDTGYQSILDFWNEDGSEEFEQFVRSDAAEQIQEAREFDRQREPLLNPPEYRDLGSKVFPPRPVLEAFLENIVTHAVTYRTVWPKHCSVDVMAIARANGHCIHTDLKMSISLPKALKRTATPTAVIICVDMHGGGGFTGSPGFIPWMFRARIEHQLHAGNIIHVDPSYPLLYETDGEGILANNYSILTWLFNQLEPTLKKWNSHIEVDWSHTNISGNSFGCGLALDLVFRELALHPARPSNLRIRTLRLLSPLTMQYCRGPGSYMGVPVPQEKANTDSKKLLHLRKSSRLMPIRAGSNPPDGMYPSHATAVSQAKGATWADFWATSSVFELVKLDGISPNERILVSLNHGMEDVHVPYHDSLDLKQMLQDKFPDVVVECRLREGQGHAEHYEEQRSEHIAVYNSY